MIRTTLIFFALAMMFSFMAEAKKGKPAAKSSTKIPAKKNTENRPAGPNPAAAFKGEPGLCDYNPEAYDKSEGAELEAASEVFMNPDSSGTTLYDVAGKNYHDCLDKTPAECGALGWPKPEDTVITKVPGSEIEYRPTFDTKCGRNTMVPFIKVKIKYPPRKYFDPDDKSEKYSSGVEAEGYMDARFLKTKKLAPLYSQKEDRPAVADPLPPPPPPAPEVCPPEQKSPVFNTAPNNKNLWGIGYLSEFLKQNHKAQVEQTAQALRAYVGECPLDPPDDKEPHLQRWKKDKTKNLYDAEVMPLLRKHKGNLPKVPKQVKNSKNQCVASTDSNNQMVNFEDLVNVDAMARTVFAEMNECIKEGSLEFPMAAAKVAKNRVEDIQNKKGHWEVFLKPTSHQATDKPLLAKTLTASYQFSVWNKNDNLRDKSMLLAMCPTRYSSNSKEMHFAVGKQYLDSWKGEAKPAVDKKTKEPIGLKNRVSGKELQVWNYAMQIATEAVLYPCDFENRTKEVTQRYYTSKMPAYAGRKKGSPSIEGRTVSSFRCMYLWEGR